MSSHMKAWFATFRSEATDPFYPFAVTCYVSASDEAYARQTAINYAAATSELREAFDDPAATATERLISVTRCPDMDDVISLDPDADGWLAKAKGLSGLTIGNDGDGPQLEWAAYASIAEARAAERDFIEYLYDNIPKHTLTAAIGNPRGADGR